MVYIDISKTTTSMLKSKTILITISEQNFICSDIQLQQIVQRDKFREYKLINKLVKDKKMSVIPNLESNNLKTDISDFIQLLQKQSTNRRRLSLDSDKLSVIYSASEPQSSSLIDNKQNSHQSANTNSHQNSNYKAHFNSNDPNQFEQLDSIIRDFAKLSPNPEHTKLIDRLAIVSASLRKAFNALEAKCRVFEVQFQEERAGTDEILKALVKMDQAQKELWTTYNELSTRYQTLEQSYKNLSISHKSLCAQNKDLQSHLSQSQKDIQFMRKLVLVANENYENLEKKCTNLERNASIIQTFREQRSSPQIVSRSSILNSNNNGNGKMFGNGKKSSCSPSISERSNMSAKGSSFEQNYRKLVLRTLKSKAIR